MYEKFELSAELESDYDIAELNPLQIKFTVDADAEKGETNSESDDKVKLEILKDEPSQKSKLEYFQIDPEKCQTLQNYLSDLTNNIFFKNTTV